MWPQIQDQIWGVYNTLARFKPEPHTPFQLNQRASRLFQMLSHRTLTHSQYREESVSKGIFVVVALPHGVGHVHKTPRVFKGMESAGTKTDRENSK